MLLQQHRPFPCTLDLGRPSSKLTTLIFQSRYRLDELVETGIEIIKG